MKRRISLLLALVMIFSFVVPVNAASVDQVNTEINNNAEFMIKTVKEPGFGTLAGEWTVLSLARSGYQLPANYVEKYHALIDDTVAKMNGVLTSNKFTEYSRLIVSLTATGKDVTNVGGHNLLTPLGDFSDVIKQGINGPIWALIAFDTKKFDVPKIANAANQNSRERMIQEILSREITDKSGVKGGWALMGNVPDPDITAMALYAMWPYYNSNANVKAASDRALQVLSDNQLSSGGYMSWGAENLESSAQVIMALTTMGIDPMTDSRFVKYDAAGNPHSVVDALLTFKLASGGFVHVQTQDKADAMATDQAMEALVAVKRFKEGKTALFDMTDVPTKGGAVAPTQPIGEFTDIANHWAKDLIVANKGYGISNGAKEFKPEQAITRGEFAFGLIKGLGINKGNKSVSFNDVKANDWYAEAITIAASNGIIEGHGDGKFAPNDVIKREEAMAIIQRSLAVKNGSANIEESKVAALLNGFADGKDVSDWARLAAAYNIDKKIIEGRTEGIVPKGNITRAEAVKVIDVASKVK